MPRAARSMFVPCLLAAVLPGAASAQTRPLQTEEATTAPRGRVALEVGQDFMKDEPNFLHGQPRNRWDGPTLRFVWSPADPVEVDLEWVTRIATPSDPVFGDVRGFGDVTLRTKLRLVDGAESRTTLGARYLVTLPQTDYEEGLGPNTLRMAAQLLLTQPLGRARVHLNAGVAIEDQPDREHFQRDFLAFGAALEVPIGALTALAEVAGKAGDGTPGADERIEARAGLRFGRGRLRGDVAVRRGLAEADGTWGATAGFSLALRDRASGP